MLALVLGLLALPTIAIFGCERGWPRLTMAAIAAVLGALGLFAVLAVLLLDPPARSPLGSAAVECLQAFFIGTFISQFAANWLASQKPRR